VLTLNIERVGRWEFAALRFSGERWSFGAQAVGAIGNSITTSELGKRRTAAWKVYVANSVRSARPASLPEQPERYAITVGFSFHLPSHGNQKLDIENFLKPTLDAVACGLFAAADLDLATVARWHFDDARFAHLLIPRLPDAAAAEQEGAALFVSAR
jgi:hypothetical protein